MSVLGLLVAVVAVELAVAVPLAVGGACWLIYEGRRVLLARGRGGRGAVG